MNPRKTTDPLELVNEERVSSFHTLSPRSERRESAQNGEVRSSFTNHSIHLVSEAAALFRLSKTHYPK